MSRKMRDIERGLAELQKDLELPRPKGYQPFDKYAYRVFAFQARSIEDQLRSLVIEVQRLRQLAIDKAHELESQE